MFSNIVFCFDYTCMHVYWKLSADVAHGGQWCRRRSPWRRHHWCQHNRMTSSPKGVGRSRRKWTSTASMNSNSSSQWRWRRSSQSCNVVCVHDRTDAHRSRRKKHVHQHRRRKYARLCHRVHDQFRFVYSFFPSVFSCVTKQQQQLVF